MYQVFLTPSLGVFSVLSVQSENYSIQNKPVVSVKKWYVILFQVDSTHIQITYYLGAVFTGACIREGRLIQTS